MTSGGLGPTDDDRTKEAVAEVLGRRLVRDERILSRLKERFRKRGYEMPDVNAKQADVIEGATVLVNRRGSAPGFLVEQGGCGFVSHGIEDLILGISQASAGSLRNS